MSSSVGRGWKQRRPHGVVTRTEGRRSAEPGVTQSRCLTETFWLQYCPSRCHVLSKRPMGEPFFSSFLTFGKFRTHAEVEKSVQCALAGPPVAPTMSSSRSVWSPSTPRAIPRQVPPHREGPGTPVPPARPCGRGRSPRASEVRVHVTVAKAPSCAMHLTCPARTQAPRMRCWGRGFAWSGRERPQPGQRALGLRPDWTLASRGTWASL